MKIIIGTRTEQNIQKILGTEKLLLKLEVLFYKINFSKTFTIKFLCQIESKTYYF